MTTYNQFKSLFSVIFKNSIKKNKRLGEKKSQRTASLIGIGIGLFFISAYFVIMTVWLTSAAINQNIHEKLLYLFLATSQFVVLFLGAFATMSYLYFSKDNQLLAGLPLQPKAVFLAKFAMAYVTEFVIGALVVLPTVTTYGIVCMVYGVPLNASFFILEFIALFLIPIIPLLIISLLSLPLMYFLAFLRKRTLSNAIAIILVFVVIFGLYFGIIGGMSSMGQQIGADGNIEIPAQFTTALDKVSKITIFNKPYVDAMSGRNISINLLIYFSGIIALLFINIGLSSFFYKKGISVLIEGDGTRDTQKSKKELVYTSIGLRHSLIKKEIKTLANTPMMLVQSLMGVILGPLMVVFMMKMGNMGLEYNGSRGELYTIGFVSYLTAIMVGATNQVAMVGFSREGKNLFSLKALPLSAEMLVKIKLQVATFINIAAVTVVAIVYAVISRNIFSAVGIGLISLSCGFAVNCLGLHNDLKKPNLDWTNATELTRNNKNSIKPVFTIIGIGLIYLILGGILGGQTIISIFWSYTIYFGVCFTINAILIIIFYKRLFENPKEMLDRVEG